MGTIVLRVVDWLFFLGVTGFLVLMVIASVAAHHLGPAAISIGLLAGWAGVLWYARSHPRKQSLHLSPWDILIGLAVVLVMPVGFVISVTQNDWLALSGFAVAFVVGIDRARVLKNRELLNARVEELEEALAI
jgi:hypothetical protein